MQIAGMTNLSVRFVSDVSSTKKREHKWDTVMVQYIEEYEFIVRFLAFDCRLWYLCKSEHSLKHCWDLFLNSRGDLGDFWGLFLWKHLRSRRLLSILFSIYSHVWLGETTEILRRYIWHLFLMETVEGFLLKFHIRSKKTQMSHTVRMQSFTINNIHNLVFDEHLRLWQAMFEFILRSGFW